MKVVTPGVKPRVDALLRSIAELWTVTDDGSLTTQSDSVRYLEGALVQLLQRPTDRVTQEEFRRSAYRGLHKAIKAGAPTVEVLEREVVLAIQALRQEPLTQYVVASRCYFSLPSGSWIPFELWGVRLAITQQLPPAIRMEEFFLSGHGRIRPDRPDGGAYYMMSVRARSAGHALDLATDDASFVFGVLNFWVNLYSSAFYLGPPKALGMLLPGSEIVAFDSNLNLIKDVYSYYTTHPREANALRSTPIDRLSQLNTLVSELEKRTGYDRKFYRNIFKLYLDAMLEKDDDYKVVRLWKLAEVLTFCTRVDYSTVARRLSVAWDEREVVFAVCSAVAHRRNNVVHGETQGTRVEDIIELFRDIIDRYIWNSLATDVPDISTWRAAVELSSSDIDLDRTLQIIPLAKILRGG